MATFVINDTWRVRAVALGELAHTFKEDPQILPWLKTRATSDRDLDVRAIVARVHYEN
ncbi:hypothetical protein F7734_03450 [Scytonema sp. UIC 10036]|uniref:hypothetical protein n=1 Tax=Scytonema sp. UIC 10036 TaxID=2304196 RepID=UPI0012DA46E0|nr:hypothetical protein [Scytonema sp. UIC 10036]MUG91591.1 hypothetical protein [Scytonema sp. UIC 10036]